MVRPENMRPADGSGAFSWLHGAAQGLFVTLFPCHCRLCEAPVLRISRIPVCNSCLDEIHPWREPVCSVCGERLLIGRALVGSDWHSRPSSGSEDHSQSSEARLHGSEAWCPQCLLIRPSFERALAYGSYQGGLRALIHLLKYERVRSLAACLGDMLAQAISPLTAEHKGHLMVVPVPLHSLKSRQRGFNQAELLARCLVKTDTRKALRLGAPVLIRRRETVSQTGLSREQRQRNVRGAFQVSQPKLVAGQDILLVDDVLTTGTTVSECARTLKQAGANRVWVATVARVQKSTELPVDNLLALSSQEIGLAANC